MIEWKDVKGYEGLYKVSNKGDVFSCRNKIKLKQYNNKSDRLKVSLSKDGNSKYFYVHRIVGFAFVENKEGKEQINHKDGNPLNNDARNLEWVTQSENIMHAYENNIMKCKISKQDIKEIFLKKENGLTISQISRDIGYSRRQIKRILDGKRKCI